MRDANLFETTDVMARAPETQVESMADTVTQLIAVHADASESYVPFADMPVLDRLRTSD